MTQQNVKLDWGYLGREVVLILLLGYVFIIGGTFTGLIAHPVRLATGALATTLFGGWLVWRLLHRGRIPATGLEVAWLVWLLAVAIAVIFSEDPRRSLSHGLIWLSYALVFYIGVDLLRRGWPAELLEKCMLVGGAIVIGFGLLQLGQLYLRWQVTTAGLEFPPSFHHRVSSVIGDPNLLSATLNLLIPLAITRAICSQNLVTRVWLGGYLAASLVLVYFTDSRGGLLALGTSLGIIGLGWVTLLSPKALQFATGVWGRLRARRLLLVGIVAIVLAITTFIGFRILGFEGDATHAPVASARDIYWQSAAFAFRKDPLSGVGPGLYPSALMQLWSMPPQRPFLHAHSTPINIGAEAGLLGLGGLVFFTYSLRKRVWRGWENLDEEGRARWVGIAAAVGGFVAHGLVDDFLSFSLIGTVLMLILAFWVYVPSVSPKSSGFSPLWLLIPGLLGVILSINPLRASGYAAEAAQQGDRGNWMAAVELLENATDLDPKFGFYWMQAGYAYGRLASENPMYLDAALASYEQALVLEPIYSLNYANLAALQRDSGAVQESLANIKFATQRAPLAWQFWLNLGAFQEEQGAAAEASTSYLQALELRPDLISSSYWEKNALRLETASMTQFTDLQAGSNRGESSRLVEQARQEIQIADLEKAEETLAAAWNLYDQEAVLYLGFGELEMARNQLELAEAYFLAGLSVLSTSNQVKSEIQLALAELNDRRGNQEEAISRYEQAFSAILNLSSYGWGGAGWTPYSYFVFQRQGFAEDTLPQLVRADIPVGIAGRLLRLAALYEDMGAVEKAEGVRAALQPYLPSISRH